MRQLVQKKLSIIVEIQSEYMSCVRSRGQNLGESSHQGCEQRLLSSLGWDVLNTMGYTGYM